MLTQDNLNKHTERHHQLNEKRDFVEEYLDSLDLSALKVATNTRTRGSLREGQELSSADTSSQLTLPLHQSQQQPRPQQQRQQQDKAKRRGTRSKLEQHSTDEVSAVRPHSRKTQESKSTPIEGTKRRDSVLAARQDETKSSKRRRQYVEAVELEVQNLDINESDTSKSALRKRRGRPTRASVKTRTLAPAKQGHEFSEEDFLNPPETLGSRRLSDQTRGKVVTSAYFTPAQDIHMDHDSTSDGNKEHGGAYFSSDSYANSEHTRHSSRVHRDRGPQSHRNQQKKVSLQGLSEISHSEKSQSEKSLSQVFSLAELDNHPPWSHSVPESQLPILPTEVLGQEAMMIPGTDQPIQHVDQTDYQPEAETTTPHCDELQNSEPAIAYEGPQQHTLVTNDPYGPSYYGHDSLGSIFYQPRQDPVMETAMYWPIQSPDALPPGQQPLQPFFESTEDINDDAVGYPMPLYALDRQPSAPSQPRFRWRPHRLY
ncbi:hypothetical protein BGZ72_001745 [Mortierella alpina]|nr:hypothetical protein BGZ72_001745 [Mortierella alpina]